MERGTVKRPRTCRPFLEDAGLGRRLPPALLRQAERERVAEVRLRRGEWDGRIEGLDHGAGVLVLEGLLLRRMLLGGRVGTELLGDGDLLRPWQTDATAVGESRWRVLQTTRLAVFDGPATARLARYTGVVDELVDRTLGRARGLVTNMAIVQQPGIELRLQALLWLLADRWGKVTPDGVRLPLRLTHAVLGEMVGARRPTVTTALSELVRRGLLESLPGGGWVLRGPPPQPIAHGAAP
jgi:CRP-like cAMP-binding protein